MTRTSAPSVVAAPPSIRVSSAAPTVTVVVVGKTSRPIDTLPVAGSARDASALPQYLTRAMLGCATAVAVVMRGLRSWWSRWLRPGAAECGRDPVRVVVVGGEGQHAAAATAARELRAEGVRCTGRRDEPVEVAARDPEVVEQSVGGVHARTERLASPRSRAVRAACARAPIASIVRGR